MGSSPGPNALALPRPTNNLGYHTESEYHDCPRFRLGDRCRAIRIDRKKVSIKRKIRIHSAASQVPSGSARIAGPNQCARRQVDAVNCVESLVCIYRIRANLVTISVCAKPAAAEGSPVDNGVKCTAGDIKQIQAEYVFAI